MSDNKIDLEKLKELEISWNKAEKPDADIFHGLQESKVSSIKSSIQEINDMIKMRENLSKEVFQDAEAVKTKINNFMFELSTTDPNNRVHLMQKLIELEELKIQEKINCWKDVAKLKDELREFAKEVKDKESRNEILNKLME